MFFARWIFGLRIFGAWIAGMVHMPWWVFSLWNAAGGITWCASVIGLGYFFGHSLDEIEKVLGVGGVIAVVSVAVVALAAWRRFERRKLHRARAPRGAPRRRRCLSHRGDARPPAGERLGDGDDLDCVDLRVDRTSSLRSTANELARALRRTQRPVRRRVRGRARPGQRAASPTGHSGR